MNLEGDLLRGFMAWGTQRPEPIHVMDATPLSLCCPSGKMRCEMYVMSDSCETEVSVTDVCERTRDRAAALWG